MVGKEYKINRDKKGRFARKDVGLIVGAIILVLLGVVYGLKLAVDWGNTHEVIVQRPWDLSFKPLVEVRKIEPQFITAYIRSVDFENLDTTETKIINAFGERNYTVMRAVAECESGMNPEAINWSSKDLGLFQINWPIWGAKITEQFGYTLKDMFDVDKNIEVAKWIWDRDGDGEGSINPWTATNTQCFRNAL